MKLPSLPDDIQGVTCTEKDDTITIHVAGGHDPQRIGRLFRTGGVLIFLGVVGLALIYFMPSRVQILLAFVAGLLLLFGLLRTLGAMDASRTYVIFDLLFPRESDLSQAAPTEAQTATSATNQALPANPLPTLLITSTRLGESQQHTFEPADVAQIYVRETAMEDGGEPLCDLVIEMKQAWERTYLTGRQPEFLHWLARLLAREMALPKPPEMDESKEP